MNKGKIMHNRTVILSLLGILLFVLGTAGAEAAITCRANHDHISIGFLYHGSTVSVRGVTDPDTDVVIKITSPEGRESLRQKGKVAGILWMNTGTLTFDHAPNFYEIFSTGKIADMLSKDEQLSHMIGYDALGEHIAVAPERNPADRQRWLDQFVRFKEKKRLYRVAESTVSLTPKSGLREYYILTEWPYQAYPGDYTVTAYAVKDGKVVDTATSNVKVEQAGIVKYLSRMSRDHAAVYGILSIVSALAAGFGVGLVFSKGGGAH